MNEEPRKRDLAAWRWLAVEIAVVAALLLITFFRSLSLFFLPGDCNWLALAKWGNAELPTLANQGAFRPLARELFGGVHAIFGLNPVPYRVALLVLHGVMAVLAGRMAARILRRKWAGWMTAAIFAVAPAGSEAVRSIASFVYPCVAVLVLGGLMLYARSIDRGSFFAWAGAMACFFTAAFFREHWIIALPLALLLEIEHGGRNAMRTRGPWLRLGPIVVAGLLYTLARKVISGAEVFPNAPEYVFDESMASRFLVTIQRLVFPAMPPALLEHPVMHQLIGAGLLLATLGVTVTAPKEDRKRVYWLLAAMVISFLPFLPVAGDHLRQRFVYLGTAFAAALMTFVVSTIAERFSPRLLVPVFLAVMVGLLLEQQVSYESAYELPALESRARFEIYPQAAQAVAESNGMAVFVGDFEPSLESARSTFRVVAPVARRQIALIVVSSTAELEDRLRSLFRGSRAHGPVRLYVRGPRGYGLVPLSELESVARRVFEGTPKGGNRETIIVLLPRPLDITDVR